MLSSLYVRGVRQLGNIDEQQLPHCPQTSVSRAVENTTNWEYPACLFSLILNEKQILFARHISIYVVIIVRTWCPRSRKIGWAAAVALPLNVGFQPIFCNFSNFAKIQLCNHIAFPKYKTTFYRRFWKANTVRATILGVYHSWRHRTFLKNLLRFFSFCWIPDCGGRRARSFEKHIGILIITL